MTDAERNLKEFLKAMSKLAIKHNITVQSCGCCDSPWLSQHPSSKIDGMYVVNDDEAMLRFIHK